MGSCRRELLNHVIPLNEQHLRCLVRDYVVYYQEDRIHDALGKDKPTLRPVEKKLSAGATVISSARLGGLHHRYSWREAGGSLRRSSPLQSTIVNRSGARVGPKVCSGVTERRIRRAGKSWARRRHRPARKPLIRGRDALDTQPMPWSRYWLHTGPIQEIKTAFMILVC